MKKVLLFLFYLLPIVAFAQQYNSPNVHYYLHEGYSIKDLEKAQDSYSDHSECRIYVIITDNYGISFGNIKCSDMPIQRDKYISELNSNILTIAKNRHFSRSNRLSNLRNTVYSYDDRKIAVSSNFKKMILWRDGHEEKRQTFYEIDINKVLPKTSDYDFLK